VQHVPPISMDILTLQSINLSSLIKFIKHNIAASLRVSTYLLVPILRPSTHHACVTDQTSLGHQAHCLLCPHPHVELSYLEVAQKLARCYYDVVLNCRLHPRTRIQMLLSKMKETMMTENKHYYRPLCSRKK
jgi:hypothetical protein